MARPTDYREEYNEKAFGLSLLGYTDAQLAKYFNVSEQTLNTWKKKHPEFLESLKAGKDDADKVIANSLYEKAKAGDTTAMIFWLKNRQRFTWRDKQQHEVTGSEGKDLNLTVEFTPCKKRKDA
jgi:DNA-binding XRE family transcriptional regulator